MEPIIMLFAWMLLIVFLALIACMFEDLESDIGSQSNPNSQVQLAAQIGQVNRFFNKAISGEAPSYALYCTIAGVVAYVLLLKDVNPLLAIPIGALAGEAIHVIFSVTAHVGRTAAQKRFEQPIYLDVLYGHLLPIATHGFMATLCITAIAYIQSNLGTLSGMPALNHPFALPLLAFIWGITVGAIGSSTGDIHYGAEREFQDRPFGEGKRVVYHGKITRYAGCGVRTQKDIAYFCAKYGGPITGLTFGLIILFESWRSLIGMMLGGYLPLQQAVASDTLVGAVARLATELLPAIPKAIGDLTAIIGIVVGLAIGIVLIVGNVVIVKWARKRYGPFVGE